MTLRKITIDNSVRYIPKKEQTKEIKQNTIKKQKQPISGGKVNTRKQNKNISQNKKKFLKNISASGFAVLKRITSCYF